MLRFERTDKSIGCEMNGQLREIMSDVIFCVGLVHNNIKEQSPEAAAKFRKGVEEWFVHGSERNTMLFERFTDDAWTERAVEKEKEKAIDEAKELLKLLQELLGEKDGDR